MNNEKTFELKQVSIRLVEDAPYLSKEKIISPKDAVRVIGKEISKFDREVMCVLNLTTDGKPINFSIVSIGAIDQTIVSPREMFKSSILSNAAQVMLLHNHPSGDVTPSKNDVSITNRMIDLYDKMGIQLLDHIIVGQDEQYYSFYSKNMFIHTGQAYSTELSDINFKVAENNTYGRDDMISNSKRQAVPNFGTNKGLHTPSPEYFIFTSHNGQRVELNGADMRRVKRYYEEQCTAEFLRENNPMWTEEKVQAIAIEARNLMFKNDYTEADAIYIAKEEFEHTHYVELATKSVLDSDGFMTEYTMYRDTFTGKYVFVFGDKEAYTPENSDWDWTCDTEVEALEWYSNYKGFEESLDENLNLSNEMGHEENTSIEESKFLGQLAFSKELKERVTKAAVSLSVLIKDIDLYHYLDASNDYEVDIAQLEQMIALNNTDKIIDDLREYNDKSYGQYLHDTKEVDELKSVAIRNAGELNEGLVEEYAKGIVPQALAQSELSPDAFQLAFLYKQKKDYFKDSEQYRAREIFRELVGLKREIYIERYKSLEPDVFFDSNDSFIAIYQLNEESKEFLFENYNFFKRNDKEITLSNYIPVYIERIKGEQWDDEELFERFNLEHPTGYVGHSLSVGDIIVKHNHGITDVSFVDSFGFQRLDSFVKEYAVETNNLMHLIRQDGDEYVCQSFNKEEYSLHHTEKMKFHQIGEHLCALDSLEDTYMKRCDVEELKNNIKNAQAEKQQEAVQNQNRRKPRL